MKNAYGELVEEKWADLLKDWLPYGAGKPIPTPLRNHQMIQDHLAGNGPHYLRTDEALQKMYADVQNDPRKVREIEADAWEDFLDMTMSQALLWASENIDPAKTPSEVVLTEPYLMGSHASGTGAWVSGPEDIAPKEYFWGYNRMTTVRGLFAAGDGVGGSAHKFSSGSYTEGRLAGKGAIAYIYDSAAAPTIDQDRVDDITKELMRPFEVWEESRPAVTRGQVNPTALSPKQSLLRLQKIMDEYVAGQGSGYITNGPTLMRGLELLKMLKRGPAAHGRQRSARSPARVGGLGPLLLRGGARAPRPLPRGDALAGLLLSRRLPEAGRGQLEVLHHVALRPGEERVDAVRRSRTSR